MIYSERFNKWFEIEMECEGTYANDPSDSGGETFMGLCRKYYPSLSIWQSLDETKGVRNKRNYIPRDEELEEIKAVYYKNYFAKVKGDYYNNELLSFQVADFAVNAGVVRSVKTLQNIMHITVDGIAGVQTVTTANNFKNVLQVFKEARKNYYIAISKKGNNKKFLKGWLNRINKIK